MPPFSGSKLTGTCHTLLAIRLSRGVQRPGREVNSPISNAEVRNGTVLSCEYRASKDRQAWASVTIFALNARYILVSRQL